MVHCSLSTWTIDNGLSVQAFFFLLEVGESKEFPSS